MKPVTDNYMKALEYLDVYEDGSVWRKERTWVSGEYGIVRHYPRQKAKVQEMKNGYLLISIRIDGKRYYLLVHRLVAEAFIPKPDGWNEKYEINHKDGNKQNNAVSNIEWVTRSENIRHADRTGLRNLTKPVEQLDLSTGEVVARYVSIHEAERQTGFAHAHISACCSGKRRSCGGFGWRYSA